MYALILRIQSSLPPEQEKLLLLPIEEHSVTAKNHTGLLNLNSASMEELKALPGIGEKTAAAIMEMREQLGGFHYVEELLQISGIGAGKLDAIYDLICVGQITQQKENAYDRQ